MDSPFYGFVLQFDLQMCLTNPTFHIIKGVAQNSFLMNSETTCHSSHIIIEFSISDITLHSQLNCGEVFLSSAQPAYIYCNVC